MGRNFNGLLPSYDEDGGGGFDDDDDYDDDCTKFHPHP
jgi:hypothetical protein